MAEEKLFHVGVKALIVNDDGKLLVMNDDVNNFELPSDEQPHTDLPGGRMHAGETPEQTLRRELLEETGISEVTNIIHVTTVLSDVHIRISATEKVGLVLMIYRVSIPAGSKIILSSEHVSYEWISIAEAKERLQYKFTTGLTDLL